MTDKTDWDAKAREIANTGTYHNAQAKETHVLRMARRIAQALRNADLRCAVRVVKARKAGIAEERERCTDMVRRLAGQPSWKMIAAIREQPDEQEKIEPAKTN